MNRVLGLLHLENSWTEVHYRWFRRAFGTYLTVHWLMLFPWAREMFSSEGVLPAKASPLLHAFPNVLALSDDPLVVTGLVAVALVASVCFTLGWRDRLAAVLIWYVWACLFSRNPLISNPGLPYVGLLLMVHALRPSLPNSETISAIPESLYAVVWVLMSVGYSYSGLYKLHSVSWVDGTAVRWVLESPLARPGAIRDLFLASPKWVIALLTYGALGLELFFAPLALSKKLRPWIWLLMLSMHLGLIVVIDFADLSLGMVMLHLFTFDPGWLRTRTKLPEGPSVF